MQIKQILAENRATITRLADHLSGGGYSASKQPKSKPQPQNLVIVHARASAAEARALPHIRISPNGRVIMMDQNSGKQLHHLGDLRRSESVTRFHLASAANGYIAPLDAELARSLSALDKRALNAAFSEADLAAAIGAALGLA
ncbi:hypothetical protein [Acidisoma sp. C75]